jgi:hypothetical protein
MDMSRSRFALAVGMLLMAAFVSFHTAAASSVHTPAAAPAFQATPAPESAPTPLPAGSPPVGAPVGEGTQQVLLILGLAILCVGAIGGGIYLRRRWIATRY